MQNAQVQRIALAFLFLFGDEKIALHGAFRAVAKLKSAHGMSELAEGLSDLDLIKSINQIYLKCRGLVSNHQRQTRPNIDGGRKTPSAMGSLRSTIDLDPWLNFRNEANEAEVLVVVLSKILGFRDEDISSALEVPLATIRYRLSRGIQQLSVHCQGSTEMRGLDNV